MSDLIKTDMLFKAALMTDDFWNENVFSSASEPKYAVNIQETPNSYKLEVSAPGFKKKDFKIVANDGTLTLTAESSRAENDDQKNYIRKEFSHASFTGAFQIPENVLEDHISAKYHNGLFTISLKKSEGGVLVKKWQVKIH